MGMRRTLSTLSRRTAIVLLCLAGNAYAQAVIFTDNLATWESSATKYANKTERQPFRKSHRQDLRKSLFFGPDVPDVDTKNDNAGSYSRPLRISGMGIR